MFINVIQEAIESFLEGHPSRSLSSLARRSGVSYSTVRRLMQGEVVEPSIEGTIIPILAVFMSMNEVYELLSKSNPNWSGTLLVGKNRTSLNNYDYEYHELDHVIVALASHEDGTTREKILFDYGHKLGSERLSELLNCGLLKEINSRIFAKDLETTEPNPRKALDHIRFAASHFDVEKGAYYQALEFLTEDAAAKTKDIFRNAVIAAQKVREEMQGKANTLVSIGLTIQHEDN